MTISSPSPGRFISRPNWIGSAAVTAAHTPGHPSFSPEPRRIDGPLLAAILASEEAYWERAYLLTARDDDFSRIPQQLAVFVGTYSTSPHSAEIFPSTQTFSGPVIYGERAVSKPADRAFATRRIFRPALDAMIRTAFVSQYGIQPSLAPWQGLPNYLANVTNGVTSSASRGANLLGTSLLDSGYAAFPSTGWVDYLDLIDELAAWHGVRVFSSAYDFDGTPAFFSLIADGMLFYSTGVSTAPWTYADYQRFRSAHTFANSPTIAALVDSSFGSSLDYLALFTDSSRRITFDRLAAFNRLAAAFDRSFIEYPSRSIVAPGVIINSTVSEAVWGTISAANLIIAPDGSISVRQGARPTWDAPIDDERSTTISEPDFDWGQRGYGNAFAEFTSNITAGAHDEPDVFQTVVADGSGIFNNFTPEEIQAGVATFAFSPLSLELVSGALSVTYSVSHGDFTTIVRTPLDTAAISDARFYIFGLATTRFRHTSKPTSAAFGPYPASGAYNHMKQLEAGAGFVVCEGSSLSSLYFIDTTSVSTLKTARCFSQAINGGSKSAADAFLLDAARAAWDMMIGEMTDDLGFSPLQPSSLASDVSQLVASVQPSVTFSPQFTVSSPANPLVATVHLNQQGEITSVEWSDDQRLVGTVALELGASASGSAASPSAAAGIANPYAALRVDWNFNTLRLNS